MEDKVYVTGHRNPDSDSICSAIAYAELKRLLGEDAIACRLGPLNEETKYILKKFGFENPLLLSDARSQLKDIEMDPPNTIRASSTIFKAWNEMLATGHRSLCIVDEKESIVGVISTSNLALTRMMNDEEIQELMASATLSALSETIQGRVVVDKSSFKSNGRVLIVPTMTVDNFADEIKQSVCVLSDNIEKQKKLIELGSACLIVTYGKPATPEVKALAEKFECAVIESQLSTMDVARVINESFSVDKVMTKNVITYQEDEYVDDVAKKMMTTRFRSYPVLNAEGVLVGAISRFHLLNHRKKRFILVDHSAKNQSIKNIDQAYLEEIIDHHHIGNIETDHPIYYRNQRCGCTSTIVAKMYQENGFEPTDGVAGLMLSAIISDTLYFKSATATPLDREVAQWLGELAGVDVEKYAVEMLNASVALVDATATQILNRDLKKYEIGRYRVAIGQTNYHNIKDIQAILPEFRENLKKEQEEKKVDLLIMMFTHVMAEGSMIVYEGPLSYIMDTVVATRFDDTSGYDADIISRKQQLVPKLSTLLKNM
ncbi:MAG: putative manganese-dependent inorganic diphosphatase [Anaerorhabdus sp.]